MKESVIERRERLFVKNLLENGGDQGKAYLAIQPDSTVKNAQFRGSLYMKRAGVRAAIREAMEGGRLTEPSAMRELFERWVFGNDGDQALKWLVTYLDKVEPAAEAPKQPAVHQHAHVHFEQMPDALRKFILMNKRYPTKEEADVIEAEIIQEG